MTSSAATRKEAVPLVLFGVPLHNLTFASTLAWIDRLVATEQSKLVATANLDFQRVAAEDPEMQRILFDADIMMADGHPIVKLSSFFGPRLDERVTGSDITPMLAGHAAKKGHRLFFLGGAPGVAEEAARILTERHPGLIIAGCYSPEKADVISMKSEEILAELERTKPDILLVAFGAPKQEKWIQMHRGEWKVPVAMGIGGSLDFIAGAQMRAPVWMQRLGLEWLGRLLADPKRLAGRYMYDGLFLMRAIGQLTAIRLSPPHPAGVRLDQTRETQRLSALGAACLLMHPLETLEEGEAEAARLLDLALGRHLVVMPERTAWLNSVELGVLVYLARICRREHRRLVVYPASRRVSRLLHAQRLHLCFPVAADPAAAVRNMERLIGESYSGSATRDESNRLVLTLPAELTAANKNTVAALVSDAWEGPTGIGVDTSPMRFVDCAGLALLVGWKARAAQEHLPLSFSGFQQVVKKIIGANHLTHLFE